MADEAGSVSNNKYAEFRTGKKTVAVVVTETWLEKLTARSSPAAARAAANYDMLKAARPVGEVETAPEQPSRSAVIAPPWSTPVSGLPTSLGS